MYKNWYQGITGRARREGGYGSTLSGAIGDPRLSRLLCALLPPGSCLVPPLKLLSSEEVIADRKKTKERKGERESERRWQLALTGGPPPEPRASSDTAGNWYRANWLSILLSLTIIMNFLKSYLFHCNVRE